VEASPGLTLFDQYRSDVDIQASLTFINAGLSLTSAGPTMINAGLVSVD
jgi:hypothetical protein